MRYLDDLHEAYSVADAWIPMADGVLLHARLWRPVGAEPTPAILEYLPYRLDDWTWPRDSERHPYYAAHGYTAVRVDIRGTGSSGGVFDDEYSEQELDDALNVISWIAEQPWCTGEVGMMGISWGGFNALQVAALRPPALKAIVTVCSSDDRYDNDVHYIGGAVLGIDLAAWAATVFAFNSRPPRPEVVGAGWVEQWRQRLEANRPLAPVWLAHQERDAYWRRGSICENYDDVQIPVLAVGGWSDPYRDTVFRLAARLSSPVRGIIGPWSHHYPDRPKAPGPGIDFLGETVRWWDQWLRGLDTRVLDEPPLRLWINDSQPPATSYDERPGRWVAVENLDRDVAWRRFPATDVAPPTVRVLRSPTYTGVDAGRYFPFGNATDLPPDQREEDSRSVCFDFPVEEGDLSILGRASARLRLSSDLPRAHVVVRLCDVDPTGASTLVTVGVLNLTKRDGMHQVSPLTPGEQVDVSIELRGIGHTFPQGHRVRLAVSSQYWPWVWPHPEEPTLLLDPAGCELTLPTWPHPHRQADEQIRFGEPVQARPIVIGAVPGETAPADPAAGVEYQAARRASRSQRSVWRDLETGDWVLEVDPGYGGTRQYPDGLTFTEDVREYYRIRENDPLSARADSRWSITLEQPGWAALIQTRSSIEATGEAFVCRNTVQAWARDGERAELVAVFEHEWVDEVPRTSC